MNELSWLVGCRCHEMTWREFDWVLEFDQKTGIVIECLWRLLENGRIRFTSEDHGHQFGLPAPVDAAAQFNFRVSGASVDAVELLSGTLDLTLRFSTRHVLQIVPDSAGYEAWQAYSKNRQFIAVGGGDVTIFGDCE